MAEPVFGVGAADVVPDTGEPVRDYHVEADQQDEHHRSVFDVAVDFAHDSAEPKQPNNFKGTKERADALLLLAGGGRQLFAISKSDSNSLTWPARD